MQGTNAYPSRSYPELEAMPTMDPALGGQYGPAAIPSRLLTNFKPPGPSSPAHSGKGPIAQRQRSGAVVEMAGRSAGLQNIGEVQNEVFHDTIRWNRPFWPNTAPLAAYAPANHQPNWTYNNGQGGQVPLSSIPVSKHRQTADTINEEYGSTRQLFPLWGTRRPLSGMDVQGQRWAAQAKMMNPYVDKLTRYGLAGSYGQTTQTLATQPVNAASNQNAFGAY